MISFPSEKSETPQDETKSLIAQAKNRTDTMRSGEFPERIAIVRGEVRLQWCLRQLGELAITKPEAKQALDDFWNAFEALVNHIVQKVKSGKPTFQFQALREWQSLGHPMEGMSSMMMPYPEKIKKMLDELPLNDLEIQYFTREVLQARELREKALQSKNLNDQVTFGKKAIVKVTDPSGIPLDGEISGDFLLVESPKTSYIGSDIRIYMRNSKKNPTEIGTSWKEIALFEGGEISQLYLAAERFHKSPPEFVATADEKLACTRLKRDNRILSKVEVDLSQQEYDAFIAALRY